MLIFAIIAAVAAQDCTFSLPDGKSVDLSSLHNSGPPDYELYAGDGYIYRANVCGTVFNNCEGDSSAIATQWSSYSTCVAILGRESDIWGSKITPTVGYIDQSDPSKGVALTYKGGDVCFDMFSYNDRSVTYNFYCDSKTSGDFTDAYESTTLCKYVFNFKTKKACVAASGKSASTPVVSNKTGLSQGSKFLILLLVASILYCGIGIAYNKYTKEGTVLESIPNKDFWIELPSLASDGLSFTMSKLKGGVEAARGKLSKQSFEPI